MPKTKVEVYDKNQLIYPFIESDHVTFSNGMKVNEMLDQSISMPTVTHEDLSFKVGVGDQDVSSAIVDSSVSEMTIKGKTYQNILPEPSTHVLTNNKEMFKVNEGLDSNVEIVDGVNKSAILKGQTLVNLVANPTHTFTQTSTINETWKQVNKYFTVDLQVGKTYIALWDMTWTNAAYAPTPTAFCFRNKDNQGVGRYSQLPSGKYYCKVTIDGSVPTPTMFRFHTSLDPGIENTLTVSNFIVLEYQEGMEEWNIPYFEGMTSVKAPVLKSVGKNLFDAKLHKGLVNQGDYYSVNEVQAASNNVEYRVEPNTQYTLSFDKYGTSLCWIGVSIDGVYGNNNNTHYSKTFTTNATGKTTIKIGANGAADKGHTISNIMLRKVNDDGIYEPYKTNILSTPEEVVLRSLPNRVCDTLNLMTGEYVQHIKEVVFDGSSDESIAMANVNDTTLVRFNIKNVAGVQTGNTNKVLCSSLPYLYIHDLSGGSATVSQECISNHSQDANVINIVIKRSRLSSVDVAGFRAYLRSNPITIQYSIATPIIKTVDLSSSGNWEKVVLDGSENWTQSTANNNYFMETSVIKSNYSTGTENLVFSGDHRLSVAKIYTSNTNTGLCIEKGGGLRIRTQQVLGGQSIEDFKAYLSQNPVMVYYQTKNHQDSTQVKQPIFFKDGHIQLSSGTDNSLIPTLDYQAKTSNSYIMDLMKANTRYTMKAKSASGTFTIDGASYGAGTNGTFTTPSSMTNKFLVMSNKTNEEVMILEGDVVSKNIPYFKGIKSAFEDESKIEVLSTGRNLCPPQPEIEGHYVRYQNGAYTQNDSYNVSKPIRVIEGHRYRLINTNFNHAYYDKNMNYVTTKIGNGVDADFYSIAPKNAVYLRVSMMKGLEVVVNTDGTKGEYRESNSTKIPILSPLRSLPNGVCDEIILDREKNKATLIQRVGHAILGQNDGWGSYDNVGDTMKVGRSVLPHVKNRGEGMSTLIPYTFNSVSQPNEGVYIYRHASSSEVRVRLKLKRTGRHDAVGMQNWLRSNNIVTLYELETPIITEIDLEGFPYIYKDGHIFLNSEIAPTMEIIYSVNQCQQISASNEDIIRHEKELTYLQKLIAQYVQVDYESVLLSLKV